MKRAANAKFHVGGRQLPLLTPDSPWLPPASLPDLRGEQVIALDTETKDEGLAASRGPAWPTGGGWVCGVSLAWAGGSIYLPVRHPDTDCMDHAVVGAYLRELLASDSAFVFQNASYDLGWLRREWGILPPRRIEDTTAMAVFIDENRPAYNLSALCRWQGLDAKDEALLREAASAYKLDPKAELWRLPGRYVGPYAEVDAAQTLALYYKLLPLLEAEKVTEAYRLEMELLPCTVDMQWRGIRVDTAQAERGMDELIKIRDDLLTEISHRLGKTGSQRVTIDTLRSSQAMASMFDAEGISFPRTEKTKQGSFKNDWMFKHPHWLPKLCAQAEQLTEGSEKFLGNYVLGYTHRGRIHASINQFKSDDGGAKTHRVSISAPPMQQMPSRTKYKGDVLTPQIIDRIRVCFQPEDGHLWFAPDYSQQEYRLIVHMAAAARLPKAEEAVDTYIREPRTDYHRMVANMTGLERPRAKDCNFAKAYGAGVPKFALMTGLSLDEASRIMDQYDELLPFVKKLGEAAKNLADSRGYIKLLDGARMHYNLWEPTYRATEEKYSGPLPLEMAERAWQGRRLRRAFTHKAGNALIQGSAARQTKAGWVAIWKMGITPLLQMHDEFGISTPPTREGREMSEAVVEQMINVVKLKVPVVVDAEYGPSWGMAKKVELPGGAVPYKASFDEAVRLMQEGKWW